MQVTCKEDLILAMNAAGITQFPLFVDRGKGWEQCGLVIRTKNALKYDAEYGLHYTSSEHAFSQAILQWPHVDAVLNSFGEQASVTALKHSERDTWMYADTPGGPETHHVFPKKVVNESTEEWTGTWDEVFVRMEERNRHLRYINGSWWAFPDKDVQRRHRIWLDTMDRSRSIDLYYGGGVVD